MDMYVRNTCRWLYKGSAFRRFVLLCGASTLVLLLIHLTTPGGDRGTRPRHRAATVQSHGGPVMLSHSGPVNTRRPVTTTRCPRPRYRSLCQERQTIVYLKVHKTGSTTLANMLQRFGSSRRLNFALPMKKRGDLRYNYFGGIGETLKADGIVSTNNSSRYNILYNHVVFNWDAFEAVFPQGAVYVTMIREPLEQFMSAVLYFINEKIYRAATENITAYLTHPDLYEPADPYLSFTNNRQSLDLGMSKNILNDEYFISEYIYTLDYKFDLVMITDYFDESLVLLKRRMCWSLKDVLYIRKNPRYKSFEFHLTPTDKYLHKQHNLADYMLYDDFLKRFYERMKNETDLVEEVLFFKDMLTKMNSFCDGKENFIILNFEESRWNPSFNVTVLECAYMRMNTLDFLDKLHHDRQQWSD